MQFMILLQVLMVCLSTAKMMVLLCAVLLHCLLTLLPMFPNSPRIIYFFASVFMMMIQVRLFSLKSILSSLFLNRRLLLMTKFNNSFSDVDKINYLLLNFQPEFFSRKQFIHHVYTKIWRRSRFSKPFVRYYAGQYWDNCPDAGRYAQAILSEDLELCL